MAPEPVIVQVTEPMTMLTDYVLAALAIAFAVRVRWRAGSFADGSVRWWCVAFSITALAALAGGTAHGFRLYLGDDLHAQTWRLTAASITLSAAFMLAAAIRSVLRPSIEPGERRKTGHRWLKRGLYLTLIGAAIVLLGWGPAEHFNHNDLYHVLQMVGLFCLYRGALTLDGLDDRL